MPTAVALSPHLDDAAFSAGATLAMLSGRGWQVRVVTAFTASVPDPRGFALACQLDKGLPAEADYMALRRAEDAAACAALGAEAVHLPLPEAPHRGYAAAAELFAGVRADDGIDLALAALLPPLLADADLLLAPQCVGAHVDHLLTVAAIDRLPARPPAAWWTDWPYAARPEAAAKRPLEARWSALPRVESPAGAAAAAAKRAACRAYASQIGFQFGGEDGLARMLAAATSEMFHVERTVPVLFSANYFRDWPSSASNTDPVTAALASEAR